MQQRAPSQVLTTGPLPWCVPRIHYRMIKKKFFCCLPRSLPFLIPPLPFAALFSAFSPRLGMGAPGEVGGGEASAVQGVAGSDGLAAVGYFGHHGVARAGVTGRAVSAGEPRVSRSGREGCRLGGDGALSWVAGERPYIIAFLPTPPPLFGFLFPHPPFFLPFLPSLHSLPSLSSFYPPPLISLPLPLKIKREEIICDPSCSANMGIAVKPAAWPPQPGRFQTRPHPSTYLFPDSIDLPGLCRNAF